MSQDINTVTLVGRLTRDAELTYGSSGMAFSKFSIAVNRRVKKGEAWEDEASFFDMTLFDKKAENMNQYLLKGGQIVVKGFLKQERWSKDGQNFSKVAVHVDDIQLVGGKREQQNEPEPRRDGDRREDFDPEPAF